MACRLTESFALADPNNTGLKWNFTDTTFLQANIVAGPLGMKAFNIFNVAGGYFNGSKSFGSQPVWIIGGWFRWNQPSPVQFWHLRLGSTVLLSLAVNASGILQVWNGGDTHQPHAGTIVGAAVQPLTVGAWVFLEWTVDCATGAYELQKADLGSDPGVIITGSTALVSSRADTFAFRSMEYPLGGGGGGTGQQPNFSLAGLRVFDGTGAQNNVACGPTRVDGFYGVSESGNGWIANVGNALNAANDHATVPLPDGDATYISPLAPGFTETFGLQPVPCLGLILAVAENVVARDASGGAIQPIVNIDRQYLFGPALNLTATYSCYQMISELSPKSGAAWTAGEVTESDWGMKNASLGVSQRVTQVYVEVLTLLDQSVLYSCGSVGSYSY